MSESANTRNIGGKSSGMLRRSVIKATVSAGVFLTSGCDIRLLQSGDENSADLIHLDITDGKGGCTKILDVRYRVVNGVTPTIQDHDSWSPRSLFGVSAKSEEELSFTNYNLRDSFTPALSSSACYAAALTSIWRYRGLDASQEYFMRATRNFCGAEFPATFLQIVSSASQVRTGQPFNFLVKDNSSLESNFDNENASWSEYRQYRKGGATYLSWGALVKNLGVSTAGYWTARVQNEILHKPNLLTTRPMAESPSLVNLKPDLYAPVTWHSNGSLLGGIYPISGTDDLISRFHSGAAILIGQSGSTFGQATLVTGMVFKPSGSETFDKATKTRKFKLDENSRITALCIMDPSKPEEPERYVREAEVADTIIDNFLKSTDFVVAIDPVALINPLT